MNRQDTDAASGSSPRGGRGEFTCPGCGRPLDIELRSTMCFAEAQVYCPACERDYRQKRGKWEPHGAESPARHREER